MPRRYNSTRRSRRDSENTRRRSVLMKPSVQITILLVVAFVVYLILQSGGNSGGNAIALPSEISVSEANTMYQNGAFVLDVRTVEEWNEFHAPNTTLIPLDELASRVSEVPRDSEIIVICRSGNRSQQGRDILLAAGFTNVTSVTGGLNEWRAAGYPIEP